MNLVVYYMDSINAVVLAVCDDEQTPIYYYVLDKERAQKLAVSLVDAAIEVREDNEIDK